MEEPNNPGQESLFSNELEEIIQHEEASVGQRFVNWLVDNLLMRYGLTYLSGTIIGYLLVYLTPDLYLSLFDGTEEVTLNLLIFGYIIVILNYIIYYTFCEKVFKGYTLGKLLSGTRAIRIDGGELTLRNAFLRTVSRLVPFEIFSAFNGNPWHDRWTETKVIKSR